MARETQWEAMRDHLAGVSCILQSVVRPTIYEQPETNITSPSRNAVYRRGTADAACSDATIALWNVYGGMMRDQVRTGIEELLDTVDVLVLNESPPQNSPLYENMISHLHTIYAPDVHWTDKPEPTGNMIISKRPFVDVNVIDLPIVTWAYHGDTLMQRNALYSQIRCGERTLGVWGTHLDIYCRPGSRRRQFAPVLEAMRRRHDNGTVLAMDANALYSIIDDRLEPLLGTLDRQGFVDVLESRPRLAFADRVMSKDLCVNDASFLDISGSDHKPIIARLSWTMMPLLS